MSRKVELQNLIVNHHRRLQKLLEIKALHGSETSPSVKIEIEDIEVEIEKLQLELDALYDDPTNQLSPPDLEVSNDSILDPEPFPKGRVLIIDDDPDDIWQDTIAGAFEDRGYETEAVSDIKSAKAALKKKEFDIVTIDMQLTKDETAEEGFSGERILALIVRKYPNTACIVISGSVEKAREYTKLQRYYGLTAFIPKLDFGDEQYIDIIIQNAKEDVKRRISSDR